MRHTPFGKTGLDFPSVVFGTSNLGNLFVEHSDKKKLAISKAWFEQATKPIVIDSAGKYGAGLALEVIGRNLRELKIAPDDVIISNKLAWSRKPLVGLEPTFEPGAWVGIEYDAEQKISCEGILECWKEGNDLLGEPYRADLLSVHDPDEYLAAAKSPDERLRRLEDIQGAYTALRELQNQGKARAIGVGVKDWRVLREIDSLISLDWVMIANSLTIYQHPPELIAFVDSLTERSIGVINSAIFHAGFLVGGNYFDYRPIDPRDSEDCKKLAWRECFQSICDQHSITAAEACIQFALSPPGVQSLALNSSRPDRLAHDVASIEREVPTSFWLAMKEARLIDPNYPYV